MTITSGDNSESAGSSGTQKGRRGRPRRSNTVSHMDNSDSEGSGMNDIPIEKNGVISVCDIQLLLEEDQTIPDSKLLSYNIEEEFVGFGMGLCAGPDRYPQTNGFASIGRGNTGNRLCYSSLWRKLPQHIPVRELAMSRYHIAVLLNNGHVYVTLNDMNESLYGNLEHFQKIPGALQNSQQEHPETANEQRNSINSSNTLLLESSIIQGSWLNIKELDDKNIRGLRIASLAADAENFEYRFGIKSFALACLSNDGKIWIVEHSLSAQGGLNHLHSIDLAQLNPKNHDEYQKDHLSGKDFYRAVDVTLSEITPINRKGFEKCEKSEELNEYNDMFDDFPFFPYKYGIAITSLLADGQSNSIILMKSTEISNSNKMVVLDLPIICRKVFCGHNADFGLILLQNGVLWNWDRRLIQKEQVEENFDSKSCINIRDFNEPGEKRLSNNINIRILKGSLSGRKVIDFSGLFGEFIALTQDGIIHEWNDPERMSIFKRPFIKNPIILTPKTHHHMVKKALLNSRYWSLDTMTSKCCNSSDFQDLFQEIGKEKEVTNADLFKEMMEKEISEMYNSNNRIIGAWLLEGTTLILYKDGALKALHNYLGRGGYDTKTGFISEDDEHHWNRHNSSIISCILLSSRLGRCIPANPIALVGLLSNFGKCKSLPDKQKQVIIQRSLVKLSLREKPVYRILACYNSIVFGILRPNARWRPGRGQGSKSQSSKRICKSDQPVQEQCKQNDEEMNLSATVNLNNLKEIINNQPKNEDLNTEAPTNCKETKINKESINQEVTKLQIPSIEEIQTNANNKADTLEQNQVSNQSKASNSKRLSSRKCRTAFKDCCNSVQDSENITPPSSSPTTNSAIISTSNTANNSTRSTGSTTNETPTLKKNKSKPNIETNPENPIPLRPNKNSTTPENKNNFEPGQQSLPAPSTSNKRLSVGSQKASEATSKIQVNNKTRKRERRSLSISENKENVNNMNNSDDKGQYYSEKGEENSSWESKKLSLVEYEVEQILSIREKPLTKQKEYLIKWKVPGHPVQPTWEPEENLNGCEELLQEFLKSIKTSRSGRLLLPCTAINKIA